MAEKNKYGQYMTPKEITNLMISLADIKENFIALEPSSGEGIFLDALLRIDNIKKIDAFEIDKNLVKKEHRKYVNLSSFVSSTVKKKYDLIIGNPPYIRWKNLEIELKNELEDNLLWNKYCNSLCDYSSIFIIKAIESLKDGGQLVFITPEYWLNTTHSQKMRDYMLDNGYFEKIIHFNETPIFDKVTVSTIIFKYVKGSNEKKIGIEVSKYNNKKKDALDKISKIDFLCSSEEYLESFKSNQFEKGSRWFLTPSKKILELKRFENKCLIKNNIYTIGEICDIGNGMVSGLDAAFQLPGKKLNANEKKNSIRVAKAKNLSRYNLLGTINYIFVNDISSEKKLKNELPYFFNLLKEYKIRLKKRYNYNRDIKFWEWVFLRNLKLFSSDKEKIFVPCKERISKKKHFRFTLVPRKIFPTQDVLALVLKDEVKEDIRYVLAFLNSQMVFDWLSLKGVKKGDIVEFSEKPVSSIPYRRIDFTKKTDLVSYNKIIKITEEILSTGGEVGFKDTLDLEFKELLK